MLIEVKVPVFSESVTEGTLINWLKKQGEHIERGENLIDIETDKVVLELPAPQSGVLAEIVKNDGSVVTSGEIIARIDTAAKGSKTAPQQAVQTAQPESATDPEQPAADKTDDVSPQPGRPLMPAAKRVADENDLTTEEITAIQGTGRDRRIIKEDVLNHIANKKSSAAASTNQQPDSQVDQAVSTIHAEKSERQEKRVPMTRLRIRIAERLVQSQSTAAILTTFNEVNMQAVLDLRARYKVSFEKEHGIKLGFTSFFVKAAVAALKKFPIINASVDGNDIIYHEYYDIGIAVASPRGLVVPIIRDADKLTFAEIEKQIADLAKRAQDGKLTIEELTGGTFSITNGGVFGSMLSTPIINPPQSAILGIHATKPRPVAENGQVVIRPMNYLALSYDHRIIDGREAVLSLVAMKEALEYPASPLFDD
ncbi:2-oxoglutarate dehydrogenase E2 component [Nitrosomonas eutropha]|uniref:Dihydrolipoyllysine-residue succinyltransferase component of 2-oxoglutarate dehydrogenase complex n=1 Tax=Nitrosomonas eutropha TaxID=916 RepID=A0A1I7IV48_9PROT|nr:2-oxoglutarate dehydrogenase complex dihydrolipoyllysine-residue succinyltransferase [Nitrosomonas eutropha]SFU76807.1 2-oxoglutarate dehydrogenase E2 component [Nitrosomonas eutropha]